MTWKEFKEIVDRRLKDSGDSEEIDIWFIDISFPDLARFEIENSIGVDKKLGLSIC